ncbi:helix-turn-helix transcriptional regulator [Actinomadura kijaniata]|uniref:helix-turn-helix transcriptional regulator n=1 Tax=Actinomadura kijaniata TaxID=46161 RepID=UPI00083703D3|nr:AraC family transcriptional regulator [Actinomadura kijaniata]
MADRSDSVVRRVEFATTDLAEAHAYLCSVYSDHTPVVSGDRERFRLRARATGEGRYGVEFVSHSMEMRTSAEPYGALLVAHVLDGRVSMAARRDEVRAAPGDAFLVPAEGRHELWWSGVELGMVRLDAAAVARLARETTGGDVAFRLSRPVSRARARYWRSAVRHVTRGLLAEPELAASPLLRAEAFRLLTTALVETFPIIEPSGAPDGRTGAAAVRRAAAFIEDNAHRGIGLTEIAAAAGTSPRSLQAAFRRHLDTTPVAHLHEVRLRRAHADLLAADPTTGVTVAAIAARWGFTHHGRFAAEYRRRFGRPPRQALRS